MKTLRGRRWLAVCASLVVVSCAGQQQPVAEKSPEPSPVERGRYLVTVAGCHDCHSPKLMTDKGPVPDPARLLSGHPQDLPLPTIDPSQLGPGKWVLFNEQLTAAVGPWGVSFSANLTSDKETGVGAWPEALFVQTLRTGKHLGSGRPLLPPMPWPNLAEASDADLKAIFAYLQTVPAIRNQVPEPIAPPELAGR